MRFDWLKDALGLSHFRRPDLTGWHHHAALVLAAFGSHARIRGHPRRVKLIAIPKVANVVNLTEGGASGNVWQSSPGLLSSPHQKLKPQTCRLADRGSLKDRVELVKSVV